MGILKDKSGASFILVLGVMLMLMAIGISALAAASANTGFVVAQREHSQVLMLSDSIHKNIMYALQREAKPAEPKEDLMSVQLVRAIHEARESEILSPSAVPATLPEAPLDIGISGVNLTDGNIKVKSIRLSFPMKLEEMVVIAEALDAIPDAVPPVGRQPRTATVNAEMVVTVEIENEARKEVVTSRATYKYTGGMLSDDPNDTGIPGSGMDFEPDGYGEWRLIKHENADRKG